MARKDGYWSGWTDYRHGPRRKVTLAPVMKKEERKRVINGVFDLLQDWRTTPFENEGAVRAGVRSGLCLQGTDWSRADLEAANVITAAFQRMGTPRPSWDQGQPQYTIPEENCNWCGVDISEDLRGNGRASRFCSTVCASAAIAYRDFEGNAHNVVYRSALSMLQREGRPDEICSYCERSFKPFGGIKRDQKFCSVVCRNLSYRELPDCECVTCHQMIRPNRAGRRFCSRKCFVAKHADPRECPCCRKLFTPANANATWCSNGCSLRALRMRRAKRAGTVYKPRGSTFEGKCFRCSEPFLAQSPKAIYCSPKCKAGAHSAKNRSRGRIIPFVPVHMLTAQVIDGWFARAA